MDSLAGSIATRRGRVLAAALATLLAFAAIAEAPYARVQLFESVAFLTIFLTLAASADALTAFLLVSQGRAGKSLPSVLLGCGYFYSTLAIVVHAFVFPGIFAAHGLLGAGVQTATWFWVWWHAGFPLFVIAYAIAHVPRGDRDRSASVTSQTIAIVAIAIAIGVGVLANATVRYERALPTLIQKGQYGLLVTSGIGPLVVLAIVAAIASVLWYTRLRTITDLWLTVALFSSLLDVSLTLVAGGRYTVGWYGARLESLVASTVVLLTFLGSIDRILARLARLSRVDGLTGLNNRRAFDQELAAHVILGRRTQHALSLLMLDVDSFKLFNDTYGHVCGDEALRAVASAIETSLARRSDIGARYGGEEFAVVLPVTDAAGAARVAERIRARLQASAVPHTGSPHRVVTASIGVATLEPDELADGHGADALVERADAALYRAKAAGRNRVESVARVALD